MKIGGWVMTYDDPHHEIGSTQYTVIVYIILLK